MIMSDSKMNSGVRSNNRNIGICLLRLMMSFVVILCHYYTGNNIVISSMRNIAVPVFMILSFVYFKNILSGNNEKILYRFKRLLYPYIIWPIIYWISYNLLHTFLKWEFKISISNLFWQIAFGASERLMPQFWYLFDLMILTVFMLMGLYYRGG